jgi:hypothetical protein
MSGGRGGGRERLRRHWNLIERNSQTEQEKELQDEGKQRTVGEKQYRLFKSTAAKKGVSLSNAFEEAVSAWVSRSDETSEDQVINDMVYRKMKNRLEKEFPGKYAVIADGKFLGAENTLEDAWAIASPFESAIVTRITKKPSYSRIFGSSLRMVGGKRYEIRL